MNHANQFCRFPGAIVERLEPRRLLTDVYEPNNSLVGATDFGSLGDREEFGLDISPSGDQDFYRFTALGSGNAFIRISFVSFFGDLDMYLYGPSNTVVASSTGTSNTEEINYSVAQGQSYTIAVAGFQGATNTYDMLIDGPDGAAAPTVTESSYQFLSDQGIQFSFDQDVAASVDANDLSVMNLTTSQTLPASAFAVQITSPGGSATVAVWNANSILPDGNYSATLNGAGVTNGSGTPVAGNPVQDFFVLSADADRSRTVDTVDFNILAANFAQSGLTFAQGNFDYDPAGNVDTVDFNLLASNFGKILPANPARNASPPATGKPARRVIDAENRVFSDRPIALLS